ncbi:unnamed protein product, partial [Linum tenue]
MEIGVIYKLMAPVSKFYWSDVIEELKQPINAKLESEFDISMTNEVMRLAVDYSLSRRFINFKHHCHKHYL